MSTVIVFRMESSTKALLLTMVFYLGPLVVSIGEAICHGFRIPDITLNSATISLRNVVIAPIAEE